MVLAFMRLPHTPTPAILDSWTEPAVERIEILEAFADLPDVRRVAGKRHHMALCLALFTLAVTAGNRGFIAIGDWLRGYRSELMALFNPPKQRLPSYSTIRRVLLNLDYSDYSAALARFFGIEPLPGETLAVVRLRRSEALGKVLRGSYQLETDNLDSPPHPAILLVSAYLVERGLILEPYPVDGKPNEINALPEFIEQLALKGVVIAFERPATPRSVRGMGDSRSGLSAFAPASMTSSRGQG